MLTAPTPRPTRCSGSRPAPTTTSPSRSAPAELRSRIRAVLRRAGPRALRRGGAAGGPLVLDRRSREVTRRRPAGRADVLRVRAAAGADGRPGALFNRQELLRAIWGDSAYRDPRGIDVHIRHLREKLEEEPERPQPDPHRARRRLPPAPPLTVRGPPRLGLRGRIVAAIALAILVMSAAAAVTLLALLAAPPARRPAARARPGARRRSGAADRDPCREHPRRLARARAPGAHAGAADRSPGLHRRRPRRARPGGDRPRPDEPPTAPQRAIARNRPVQSVAGEGDGRRASPTPSTPTVAGWPSCSEAPRRPARRRDGRRAGPASWPCAWGSPSRSSCGRPAGREARATHDGPAAHRAARGRAGLEWPRSCRRRGNPTRSAT